MSNAKKGREVFFEFTRLNENLRACAIDAASGIEVVTVLPIQTSEHDAQNIVLKKLLWRLGQKDETAEVDTIHIKHKFGKYL